MNQAATIQLTIKVIPNSSQSMVAGWLGNELKVKVTAQAEKGKANKEVETVIAKALNLHKRDVLVISGKTSQHKIIQINASNFDEIMAKLKSISTC